MASSTSLLSEGLELPEVSLVAVFGADRKGLLRSANSLIQTIRFATRNVRGKTAPSADHVTGTMALAMEETARRRAKREAHNAQHGITPTTIDLRVADVLESLRETPGASAKSKRKGKKVGDLAVAAPSDLTAEQAGKELAWLEKQMFQHAQNLEFKEATASRPSKTGCCSATRHNGPQGSATGARVPPGHPQELSKPPSRPA